VAVEALTASDYTLATLLDQRVAEHPDHAYLQATPDPQAHAGATGPWPARPSAPRPRCCAPRRAAPRRAHGRERRRGGGGDLACLAHGLLVTPLNPQGDADSLAFALERMRVNLVVVETEEARATLERLRPRVPPFRLMPLDPPRRADAPRDLAGRGGGRAVSGRGAPRPRAPPRSGPLRAGHGHVHVGQHRRAQGVVHTGHGLVAKRFARAAALPAVGDDERLVAYLPLFHTFGRYFELMGMLFWGGSYVFAGNPSFETLAARCPASSPAA